MPRIFITGSSDGLGLFAANHLIKAGHSVVLHARNASRAADAQRASPNAAAVVTGDLSSISETRHLAAQVNSLGPFDAVIYNAGLYRGGYKKTVDGLPSLTAVNTFATYILNKLISPVPKRVVFLSSGLHRGGDAELKDVDWKTRGEKGWSDSQAYGESKLHNILLANALSRGWNEGAEGGSEVFANSLDPGWVPTKMGGSSATGSWDAAVQSYEYLATEVESTAGYWEPGKRKSTPVKEAGDEKRWDKLLKICADVTGV